MIFNKQITTLRELDELLPMIEGFHKTQPWCGLFPFTGYLLCLTLNFTNLGIWGWWEEHEAIEEPILIGYVIAGLQMTNMVKECIFYEAYSAINHPLKYTREGFETVKEWGKNNGAEILSMYTESERVRDAGIKRYGFEVSRYYLTQRL